MLDSLKVPKWQAHIVSEIGSLSFVEIVFIGVSNRQYHSRLSSGFAGRFQYALYNLYRKTDLFIGRRGAGFEDPFRCVDITDKVSGYRQFIVEHSSDQNTYDLPVQILDQIREVDLGVIINLGCGIVGQALLRAARFGVWEYHFGNLRNGSVLDGFWEMYTNQSVAESTLDAKMADGNVYNLYRANSGISRYSLYVSRARKYWKSSRFVITRLKNLDEFGWEYLTTVDGANLSAPNSGVQPHTLPPGNFKMLPFVARICHRLLVRLIKKIFGLDVWVVGVRKKMISCPSTEWLGSTSGFRQVLSQRESYLADPIVVERNGMNFVFCEEFQCKNGKGVITCFEINENAELSSPVIVLERPYHLSYPFVFEWSRDYWMIPESSRNKTIELYKCTQFPGRWKLDTVLFSGVRAWDSTIFQENGRIWLFTCMNQGIESTTDELFLFYADDIHGPWKSHPRNPIVSDARFARGAGAIFLDGKDRIRPSQNCAQSYGKCINFNRIKVLNEREYSEEPVGRVGGEWYPGAYGAHTWNGNKHFEVIDAAVWKFSLLRIR